MSTEVSIVLLRPMCLSHSNCVFAGGTTSNVSFCAAAGSLSLVVDIVVYADLRLQLTSHVDNGHEHFRHFLLVGYTVCTNTTTKTYCLCRIGNCS